MDLLDQLPFEVQDELFTRYIFNNFIHNFRFFFQIEKIKKMSGTSLGFIRDFYTWKNKEYRNFMIAILSKLEPIFYNKGTKIYNELDEFGEINFITHGDVSVGFKINNFEQYPVKFKNRCVIGGFGVTFKQRSSFIYKATSNCKGLFIRRGNWHDILNEQDPEICKNFKKNICIDFILKIKSKLDIHKKKAIK